MTQEALKLALDALEVATTPLAKDRQKVLRAITALEEALAQTQEQEPVAFAGIEMWVGGARITKHITKTEFFKTREAWLLMKYSADWCLAKLKEKNT